MPEPIVAVDPGAYQTAAALVVGEQWRPVAAPGTGSTPWPAVGAGRDGAASLADLLAAVRNEAQRRHGGPVTRLVMAGDQPAQALDGAGFSDVESIPPAVAAVLDPAATPEFPAGVVLVCDLGAGWTASLVRVAGDDSTVLASATSTSGEAQVEARLRWLVDSCAALVSETGAVPAGVVLVGGWTLHRGVLDYLRRALPGPHRPSPEPELAVLRGLVRWAAGAGHRRVPAQPPRWRVEPLSWRIPDQDARVTRWLVAEGMPFSAGTVLAQVRTSADRVYELAAATDGAMLSHGVRAGARTGPTLVAAVAPAVNAATYDPPRRRHRWSTTGGWLLIGQWLVEWDRAGRYVHTRSLADGEITVSLQPDHGSHAPQWAGVFLDPTGRACLLTWDRGEAWLWDVAGGGLRCRLSGLGAGGRLLVDERRWRLAVEQPDAVSKGRYRRTAVTFWDLASGGQLDRLVDDHWLRRHPGYLARSGADRFAAEALSPDRRLRAVAGRDAVTLYETATDRPVFNASYPDARVLRTAVSPDGRFLLATGETDDRSTVDVWHL
jgi:molecular chaperone DnaK